MESFYGTFTTSVKIDSSVDAGTECIDFICNIHTERQHQRKQKSVKILLGQWLFLRLVQCEHGFTANELLLVSFRFRFRSAWEGHCTARVLHEALSIQSS